GNKARLSYPNWNGYIPTNSIGLDNSGFFSILLGIRRTICMIELREGFENIFGVLLVQGKIIETLF
uniref:Uncharacterized protein n=1 Tax=Megaselia scalaris TaxID=36166 RepID=T1GAW4_MEGSC